MRTAIAGLTLLAALTSGRLYADADADVMTSNDTSMCPEVLRIKATHFKNNVVDIAAPYDEGYTYVGQGPTGEVWHGETLGVKTSFLDAQYRLKAERSKVQAGKITCIYDGKTTSHDGSAPAPHLELHQKK